MKFLGKSAYIEIHKPYTFRNVQIEVGTNSKVIIGSTFDSFIQNTKFYVHGKNNYIEIGENTHMRGGQIIIGHDTNKGVIIGKNCMFGSHFDIRTSDSHTIYDLNTLELINADESVIIGDHVWLGHAVKVLKGSVIQSNSVIGTGSLVTRKFNEPNVVIGGHPAKIIKHSINWDKISPNKYHPDKS
ncbi:acyltransferase [Methanobrevibacter curvatus]|uniref:Maltose O-acetyltransferase n=1 Tax=Methanobrevibacter curvatus TaxID=49547 RepID=A0A162FF66_9EURY|nr:acyltransferase [Methanobrevibacter curvatus]KZX12195.1 maltose O-acetyltransferase [Methanobrevibacter curvatus]